MRLILTRHGETEENKAGIMQGHMEGTLSKEGILQAKKLANRLKDEHIDAIFSSDLKRAADTAREIAKYHKDTPLIITKELRERDIGQFQGKKSAEVDWNNRPSDMETREHLIVRVKALLDKVYVKHKDKAVLLVAHGGTNKALISTIMGKGPEHFDKLGFQHNTSVSIFDIEEGKDHKIHLLNCKKHLED